MNYPAPTDLAESDQNPDWLTAPHPARIYDYWLGGKDHFAADRQVATEVGRYWPEAINAAQASRAFGRRVTWYAAAGCGIRQFLDIGPGLPAPDSTLEVSQRISPACRVVYADNDPVVLTHSRAQTITSGPDGTCEVIEADLRDPDALLAQAATVLDFDQPVAVLVLGVLHFIGDAEDPAAIIARLADGLAPRSMIAVSSLTADCAPGPVAAGVAAWKARVPVPLIPRSGAELTALFGDLPLQWPGTVPVTQWRPSLRESPRAHADMLGAVARIPATGDHHWRNAALWPAPS